MRAYAIYADRCAQLETEKMKSSFIHIILIILIGFGCNGKKELNSIIENQPIEEINEENVPNELTKEDSEREEYYGFDTLLIKEYRSESGHKIKLEGSKSKDIYRIRVESKKGKSNKFKIADNWYIASHSFIVWDNEDYILVRYGCGTGCWGGLILSLNDNRGITDYQGYIYNDSIRNLVVYPDSNNLHQIIIENFDNQKRISSKLDLCQMSAIPMEMVDTVYVYEKELVVRYKSTNCELKETMKINIEKIEN